MVASFPGSSQPFGHILCEKAWEESGDEARQMVEGAVTYEQKMSTISTGNQ